MTVSSASSGTSSSGSAGIVGTDLVLDNGLVMRKYGEEV